MVTVESEGRVVTYVVFDAAAAGPVAVPGTGACDVEEGAAPCVW